MRCVAALQAVTCVQHASVAGPGSQSNELGTYLRYILQLSHGLTGGTGELFTGACYT